MTMEEIKKDIVANITEFVTNDAKNAAVAWLKDTALPAVKEIADSYTTALKADAEKETGWNKFRDSAFLPTLISVVLWVVDKVTSSFTFCEQKKVCIYGSFFVLFYGKKNQYGDSSLQFSMDRSIMLFC